MHFEIMDQDWFGIPLYVGSRSYEQMTVSVPWGFLQAQQLYLSS